VGRCKDPERQNKILNGVRKAEEQLQQLRSLAAKLLRQPNDPAVHQAISRTLADVKAASKGPSSVLLMARPKRGSHLCRAGRCCGCTARREARQHGWLVAV